jgi:hypothetical protein
VFCLFSLCSIYFLHIKGPFDVVSAAFNSADTNRDGHLDPVEFKKFVEGGL